MITMTTIKRRCLVWRSYISNFPRYYKRGIFPLALIIFYCLFVLTRRKPWEEKDFVQYKRSRNLHYYLNITKAIIEPTGSPCPERSEAAVIAGVVSAPTYEVRRNTIRETWGRYIKTIFFVGATHYDMLVTLAAEANKYNDIVVFGLEDHYQNLTIKIGLMFNWILRKCPETYYFVYKADDDIAVNPWHLKDILREKKSAKVFGSIYRDHKIIRNVYNKWYIPRFLCNEERISDYIGGTYMFNGKYVKEVIEATKSVPMHNMDDIYYTYHVAQKQLKYELTGKKKLYDFMYYVYWLKYPNCFFFCHKPVFIELAPFEIRAIWNKVAEMGKRYEAGENVCELCARKGAAANYTGLLDTW